MPKGVYHHHVLSPSDRFERFIERIPECGCWVWTGALLPWGYGAFNNGDRQVRAHRYSWEIHNGPIPKGMNVLHHCDTPSCVNPYHLFLGTLSDNMRDCSSKGRLRLPSFIGEQHGMAKLTNSQVALIRADNRNPKIIAKEFSVSYSTVWEIKTGRSRRG